jgi:PAS domain S-box-containing protein
LGGPRAAAAVEVVGLRWFGNSATPEKVVDDDEHTSGCANRRPQSMIDHAEIEALVHSSPHPAWLAASNGDCEYANAALQHLTGLNSDQLQQAAWFEFLVEEDRECVKASWQRSLASGAPYRTRVRIRGLDGIPATVELIAFGHTLREGQELWLFTGLHVHGAPHQYAPLEAHLQATLDVIPAFTWYAAPSGALMFVNERTADYLGLPTDHPLRFGIDVGAAWDSHIQLLHPDDHEETRRVWATCLRTGSAVDVTIRIRNAEGKYRWFLSRAEPLRACNGTLLYWVGVNLDIEERTQLEFHLCEGQRLAHMGSWAFNSAGFDYWSAELFTIHGIAPSRTPPTVGEYLDLVHPEDRGFMKQAIEKMLVDHLGFDFTKRIARPDGEIRHVRCVGVPQTHGGVFQGFVGTGIDVTEHEELTKALRKSEMELQQTLDFAPQLICVFGPRRERLYANRTALEYVDVSLDEWLQRGIASDIHPDDVERLGVCAEQALSAGLPYELELRVRGRDGSYRWFLARYNPVCDDEGQILRWYVAYTDIDAHKRAEERLQQENVALREEVDNASMFEEIVGGSPALTAVLSRVSKVAGSDSTVLIAGETGTGKELVARAIHRRSRRASRAFVAVNCAAIPRDLIVSELFGHEKGAFTGAVQRRLGRFELANGGTIFLDEVGELASDTQVALLRVLQEREFERVGGRERIKVDVRVISASNRDLTAAAADGTFRQDLFYRLNVFPLEMPPLRERREDIPELVEYFIGRYARKAGKTFRRIGKRTLDRLQSYPWPGNVRELQNVIERSVIVSDTDVFTVDESWLSAAPAVESGLDLSSTLAAHEKAIVEDALRASGGRVFGPCGAAARLGIPRSTLESKIRALNINKNRFRVWAPMNT